MSFIKQEIDESQEEVGPPQAQASESSLFGAGPRTESDSAGSGDAKKPSPEEENTDPPTVKMHMGSKQGTGMKPSMSSSSSSGAVNLQSSVMQLLQNATFQSMNDAQKSLVLSQCMLSSSTSPSILGYEPGSVSKELKMQGALTKKPLLSTLEGFRAYRTSLFDSFPLRQDIHFRLFGPTVELNVTGLDVMSEDYKGKEDFPLFHYTKLQKTMNTPASPNEKNQLCFY